MSPNVLSPESLAAATARVMTRRRLLRNAGGVALGAALTTAYLGTRPEAKAACTTSSVCGPSPLCGSFRCDGYHCDVIANETLWAKWGPGEQPCSVDSGVDNCWDVCSPAGKEHRCCDCCAKDPGCTTGAACTHNTLCPSGNWRKCICRAQIGNC
jgi:hypothetical protein